MGVSRNHGAGILTPNSRAQMFGAWKLGGHVVSRQMHKTNMYACAHIHNSMYKGYSRASLEA